MAKQIGVPTAGGDSPGPQRRNARFWQVRHTNPRHVPILGHVQRSGTPSPAGCRKTVPLDHPWLLTARNLGVGLGD